MKVSCKICGRVHRAQSLASPECCQCGNPLDVPADVLVAEEVAPDEIPSAEAAPQEVGPDDTAIFYVVTGIAIAIVFTTLVAIAACWLLLGSSQSSHASTGRDSEPTVVMNPNPRTEELGTEALDTAVPTTDVPRPSYLRPWKPHLDSQGRFRCEFPQCAKPLDNWRDQPTVRACVAYDDKLGGVFTVFYRDLSDSEAADPDAVLQQELEAVEFSGTKARSEVIEDNGWQGRHVEWRRASGKVSTARLLIADGRLYGLLIEAVDRSIAERFYNKFELLPAKTDTQPTEETASQNADDANESDILNDPLVQALAASDRRRVDAAFRELGRQRPDPRRTGVVKALEYVMLTSQHGRHRQKAAEALGSWANEQSVPSLVRALDDDSSFVARAAMVPLSRFPTPTALAALTASFSRRSYRHAAGEALVAAGPAAVPYIGHILRTSRDDFERAAACDLLADIGTWKARAMLAGLTNDRSLHVRSRAQSALRRLDSR